MIAKSTVYLNDDGKAVPEGDKSARRLLVREGSEIPDVLLEKHEGAAELAGGLKEKKKEPESPLVIPGTVEHREPHIEHRDPLHRKK